MQRSMPILSQARKGNGGGGGRGSHHHQILFSSPVWMMERPRERLKDLQPYFLLCPSQAVKGSPAKDFFFLTDSVFHLSLTPSFG